MPAKWRRFAMTAPMGVPTFGYRFPRATSGRLHGFKPQAEELPVFLTKPELRKIHIQHVRLVRRVSRCFTDRRAVAGRCDISGTETTTRAADKRGASPRSAVS